MRTVRNKYLLIPKLSRHIPGALLLLALIAAGPARAQYDYSLDYQTNTISGVTSNWIGTSGYVVGSNTFLNALIVNSGGVLSNGFGYVGYATGADYNSVLVSGSGSVWSNAFAFQLGRLGRDNQLIITNSGVVYSQTALIGASTTTSNNFAVVTGTDSRWGVDGSFTVGGAGSNSLFILNGGQVASQSGVLSAGNASANNNYVLVSGIGSAWSNVLTLTVGNGAGKNLLVVTNGGLVTANAVEIGNTANSSNNHVIVAGGGAKIESPSVVIGDLGDTNSVTINSGGSVVARNVYVGWNPGADGNLLAVSGGDLYATNSILTGTLDISRGTLSFNGGSITVDRLFATNGTSSIITINSGTLISRGTTVSNFQNFVIGNTGGGGATFIANGGTHRFTNDLVVGNQSAGNRLVISNGANVVNGMGYLGSNTASTGNAVLVAGGGSVWSNRNDLIIGYDGAGNTLTITNGGAVINGQGSVGYFSDNNRALVTGAGSIWSNRNDLIIGYDGAGNTLTISNGGAVFNLIGNLGDFAGASNNSVFVTGSGSAWSNAGQLIVGDASGSNTLSIANGGLVVSESGIIGNSGGSNAVVVAGAGSRWTNSTDLSIGVSSAGNSLTISNGGAVFNRIATVSGASGGSNTILVTGAGSVWNSSSNLLLGTGPNNIGNRLIVSNGASVFNQNGSIGSNILSVGNSVLVTGSGSVWSNRNTLFVGVYASGSQLTIANSGTVFNVNAFIGANQASTSNSVLVTGTGSVWRSSGSLTVGYLGGTNSLTISNGGRVFNDDGYVGRHFTGAPVSSNTVLVTGAGSVWSNGGVVIIGDSGSFNSLTISSGGQVLALGGAIMGNTASSQGTGNFNRVTVTGTGSLWRVTGNLNAGYAGSSNSISILNGGVISNGQGVVGGLSSGRDNVALVSGFGSMWTNTGDFIVGSQAQGTSLVISNGGVVYSADGTIGSEATGDNNSAIVTGAGSVWRNSGTLSVGDLGSTNSLIVRDGGVVSATNGYVGNRAGGNQATVTGSGSVWSNSLDMGIGRASASGNLFTITNGGSVINSDGVLGEQSTSSNNVVTVSANGAQWNNRRTLYVGEAGDTNTLNIGTGGSVLASNAFVGFAVGADGNRINVTGGNLYVTNALGAGTLDIRRGTLTLSAGGITTDRLLLTNGLSSVITFNGGTLISRGTTVSNFQNFVIGDTGSGGATFIANGGTHLFTNELYVGNFAPGNSLIVSNGALVVADGGQVGFNSASSNNSVLVTGAGSVWSNRFDLFMGRDGAGNQMIVSNGGVVFSDFGYVGSVSSSNTATISGSSAAWRNQSDLVVGEDGSFNRLFVTNGATVANVNADIGWVTGRISNSVTVAGGGARWDNMGELTVGRSASSNSLTIGVAGLVTASNAVVGRFSAATGNRININGGSLFVTNATGTGALDIRRGTLTASAGGSITVQNLNISPTGVVNLTSSRILVTGVTTNSGTFTMLNSVGTFNSSVVNSGAWITDPTTNVFNGTYTVTASGYINAAGDVYEFRSNLVNQSTQNTSWDTLSTTPGGSGAAGTKFIFDGTNTVASTGYTQQFYTAGVLLTGGFYGTPASVTATQEVTSFAAVTGFQNNFAVDRLELGNAGTNSILELFDTFGTVSASDGQVASLFVNDLWIFGSSRLILSNNTRLYFVNSNNWSSANYSLLGNAELHQLVLSDSFVAVVPEPSVALLWLVGAGTYYVSRRRRRQRQ